MNRADVEDIYPLSPLQQGMLVHYLEARRSGVYFEQFVCGLEGELDAEAFERAWRRVVARHPALRTAFVWQGVREPMQVVRRRLEIDLERQDWTALSKGEAERRWRQLLARDLEHGFKLTQAPLLRLRLVRTDERNHHFLMSFPHLLLDGWSLGLVIQEVLVTYQAEIRGESLELAPVRRFRDYITWLKGRDAPAAEAYWRRALANFREATHVGLAPPRREPGTMTHQTLAVEPRATAELQALARRHRLTFNTLAQGAWALLLSRYSNRSDVVFGATTSGRPADLLGVEQMVGLFINTVPVRARVAEDRPVLEWLQDLQDEQGERLRHEHTPLIDIQRWSEVPAGQPLFETLLVFENFPIPEASEDAGEQPALTLVAPDVEERTNYPLAIGMQPGERLALRALYDRSRLSDVAARRILEHLVRLFSGLAEDPGVRPGQLRLLSRSEQHQFRVEWNDSAAVQPRDLSIPRIFESWVARTPRAEAAVFGDLSLNYRELDERAGRLAGHLRSLGVGAEVLVGLYLDRSIEVPVAVLAVLKAGGAFLPLDPAYPEERLRFMLEDSAAKVIVTVAALAPRLAASAAQTVILDDAEVAAEIACASAPQIAVANDQLAYVIYTSGSTGRPKGAQLSHRGLTNLTLARSLEAVGPGDRVLQFSALSFDLFVWETVLAFGFGAALILAPAEDILPGRPLAEFLAENRIAAAILPPSVAALMPRTELPALTTLVLAGEVCPAELVDRWAADSRFGNGYGPTEASVISTASWCSPGTGKPSIGQPIDNVRVYVVDPRLRLLSGGLAGELLIAGLGLARGYLGRPALTAERFVPDPFAGGSTAPPVGARLYRTGDLACRLPGSEIDFLGRIDHQVKVRGFRIEPGEIEAGLRAHPGVAEAVVEARAGDRLVAWWVARGRGAPAVDELRRFLGQALPAYMVPSIFGELEALPRLPNGKIDRTALGRRPLPGARTAVAELGGELEHKIAAIWCEVLELESVGAENNFFDLGGHSLAMVRVHGRLEETLEREIPLVELFWHPSVRALAVHLGSAQAQRRHGVERARARREAAVGAGAPIAVIGLACRFPGAADAGAFWRNLEAGVESITHFEDSELIAAGISAELLRDPAYVRSKGWLAGAEAFDNALFGVSPREAQMLDPQHRLLLEGAREALDDAGYDPRQSGDAIGLFAGSAMNTYWFNLVTNHEFMAAVDPFQAMLGNDKDFLTTRVSYKLGLKGPSVAVQTACSTSLVAVHLASRSLAAGECDLALAGGVTITSPRKSGYLYSEEGIFSPDGHCRAFDERARGTVGGEGVGLVVLKPLARALADGDAIRAVIRGSAINNDGSLKVGYTAPSVEGQAEVIGEALEIAGVEPGDITHIEAHGSGTALGDPIEVAALHEVFRPRTTKRGYCALGAVKTNIGHTDAAAGIAGLIKTVLALEATTLPPSLHFERPNPNIDFGDSPFYVNTEARAWPANGGPRRAGVSAFGLGGTNAHVVVEEAPEPTASGAGREHQLLLLSAHDDEALTAAGVRLAEHLAANQESPLADVAFTLHSGRQHLRCRYAAVCRDSAEAVAVLSGERPGRLLEGTVEGEAPPVVFLFSGLGDHSVGMARGLYESESVLRQAIDHAADRLAPHLGCDLREVLYPTAAEAPVGELGSGPDLRRLLGRDRSTTTADHGLRDTRLAQPAVFAVEIALARLWHSWGIEPQAMIGYSLGEYVAACLAGVFEFDDALTLVAERARLIDELPAGGMLAVALGEAELASWIDDELSLAATNGPHLSVVSGPEVSLAHLARELERREIVSRRLETTHAFHSSMMAPIVERFRAAIGRVRLSAPQIPFVSNVTGTWITDEQATDPEYWVRHLLGTVRFAEGLETLLGDGDRLLLEVGPGQALATTARQHPALGEGCGVLASLRDPREPVSDVAFLLQTLGRLWLAGVQVRASDLYADQTRRRVRLPTYPFQRQHFWIEAGELAAAVAEPTMPKRLADPSEWFYVPSWIRSAASEVAEAIGPWLIFTDDQDLAAELAPRLGEVVRVRAGRDFERVSDHEFVIDPGAREHYDQLFEMLEREHRMPSRIAHLLSLKSATGGVWPEDPFEAAQAQGFFSLMGLAQALGRRRLPTTGVEIVVVVGGLFSVSGDELLRPEAATLLGLCLGIPREMPGVTCRLVDGVAPAGEAARRALAEGLGVELQSRESEPIVALRGRHRWLRRWQPVRWAERAEPPACLRAGGTYLITGGLGGMGLAIADYLARDFGAHIGLVQRRDFPPREHWGDWLAELGEDDPTHQAIRAVEALESAGAEVEVLTADVADRDQLERAAARLRTRFGRVHGIFHTAGVPGGGLIQNQEPENVAAVWAPKIAGTLRLLEAFGDEAEFLMASSSLVSVVGLPDRAEYAAANAFLDAFARSRAGAPGPAILTVNWDSWIGTAMGLPADWSADNGMTAQEGIEVLVRVLHRMEPRVAVSTLDLPAIAEHYDRLDPDQILEQMMGRPAGAPAMPRPGLATAYRAPSNVTEEALVEIWGEVLGIEQIGVDDNFLELGGDSILSLQVIARARRADLHLNLAQIFDRPTIAGLAEVAGTAAAIEAEQGPVVGDVPLTPIQAWFFERQMPERHHWNQSLLLTVAEDLDPVVLGHALDHLLAHHDALRMRYERDPDRLVRQVLEPPRAGTPQVVIDLAQLAPEDRSVTLEAAAEDLQSSLDLSAGTVLRAAWFDFGPRAGGRLFLIVHHLVIDAVSWRVVLEDLETAYAQSSRGESIELPPKTTSLKLWSERLREHVASGAVDAELEYWLTPERTDAARLPVDFPGGTNTMASRLSVTATLDADSTRALQQEILRIYDGEIDDVLLSALARTVVRWVGGLSVLVDLEGHGREPLFEDVDLSRTVGWFTSLYPLPLALTGTALEDPGEALLTMREERGRLPQHGLGYGLLRYLSASDELSRRFAEPSGAELSFVFLGRFDQTLTSDSMMSPATEGTGSEMSPRGLRPHLVDVTALISGGELQATWAFSANLHRRETIARLAEDFIEALRELVSHGRAREEGRYTPSHFPQAKLDSADLEDLIGHLEMPEEEPVL